MRRGTLAVALIAAALAAAAPAHAHEEPAGSTSYGLVSFSKHGIPGATAAERSAAYHELYHAGVRAIRLDMVWHRVERPAGSFDFGELDAEVAAITAAGLRVIGLLGYGHPAYSTAGGAVERATGGGGLPPFGVGSAHYFPPDDPADFARFARETAEHFGDEVLAWEVWNEENEGWRFWAPHEDPAAYADLLCAAYGELKGVDAATPVLFGGVFYPALPGGIPGMSGPDFVRAAYEARPRVRECFDAMAYHPYPYPFTSPELDVPIRGSVLSAAAGMRRAMPPEDRDKPLWITEIGWPTHDRAYGVSEEKQAQYVARMQAATFAQEGVPVVNWYTYGDFEDPSGANQEAHFGFFDASGEPKPAYKALQTFDDVFRGASFMAHRSEELGLPPGGLMTGGRGFALEYASAEATITALWYANESVAEAQGAGGAADGGLLAGETITVELPVEAAIVDVVDHLGVRRSAIAEGGAVTLELGPGPLYVIDRG